MPDKYHDIKNDPDHVNNHPEKRSENPYKAVFTSSSDKPRPSDLGSGMAEKAASALLRRRKELEDI